MVTAFGNTSLVLNGQILGEVNALYGSVASHFAMEVSVVGDLGPSPGQHVVAVVPVAFVCRGRQFHVFALLLSACCCLVTLLKIRAVFVLVVCVGM